MDGRIPRELARNLRDSRHRELEIPHPRECPDVNSPGPLSRRGGIRHERAPRPITLRRIASRNLDRDANVPDGKLVTRGYIPVPRRITVSPRVDLRDIYGGILRGTLRDDSLTQRFPHLMRKCRGAFEL